MKIGIIGAGTMGRGIAQIAAAAGMEALVYDMQPEAQAASLDYLQKIMGRLAAKGKITDAEGKAILGRIFMVENMSSLSEADLVIEAVVENLEIKRSIFKQLESICGEDTILATNTSSLSVSAIAGTCSKPERVVGIHFFNPVPLMRLVEIIPALQTDDALVDRARQIIKSWGKQTVTVSDTPGFIVNRVARPYYSEALRILDEGIADIPTIDQAMTDLGKFRMGPFALMDFIGHDVNYKVTESMFHAYFGEPRYKPSFSQKKLMDAGRLGRKTGRGFYVHPYEKPEQEPLKDSEIGHTIFRRILFMLFNEAADALFWKVASRDDIDRAMQLGANYPARLLKWADETGLKEIVDYLDDLYNYYREERYRCSPLLRDLANNGNQFYG